MPGALWPGQRKFDLFPPPRKSESGPSLQVKLEDWLQLWVILPSIQRETALSLDCSFTRDEGHAWLAREMVLSKASKSSTISASWEMGPRVNGKAVRGRSHPFSVWEVSHSNCYTKLAGHG